MKLFGFLASLFTNLSSQKSSSFDEALQAETPAKEIWIIPDSAVSGATGTVLNAYKEASLEAAVKQQQWASDAFDRARMVQQQNEEPPQETDLERARDMARSINNREKPSSSTNSEAALEKARDMARSINERQHEAPPQSFER